MTGLYPDEIPERIIPPVDSKRVEKTYLIGKYEWDSGSEPESADENHRLYPKYWHTSYGQFKEDDRYLELYKRLKPLALADSLDSDELDEFLDKIGIEEFYQRDEAFINHMREAHGVPNKPVPDEDSREAARLWIKYLLERGPKKD